MAELPSSVSGQTINIRPVQPWAEQTSSALFALKKLADAGVVSPTDIADQLVKARRAKSELRRLDSEDEIRPLESELRRSQLEGQIGLMPDEIALEKAQIGGDLQIVPKNTQATLGRLDSELQINPLKTESDIAGLRTTLPAAHLTEQEMQQDPTGVRTQARQIFTALYPGQSLPKKADGSVDYDRMSAQAAPYLQLRRLYSTDAGKAALKAVEDKKAWNLLFDPKGLPRHPNDVLKDAAAAAPPMDAKDVGANASAVADIDHSLDDISKARGLVGSKEEPVGPRLSQGGLPILPRVRAALGGDATKFDEQQRLTKTLAGGILTSIQALRGLGQIRNTEIEWLEKHQPDLSSTKEFWQDWLNKSEDLLRRGREVKMQTLPKSIADVAGQASRVAHTPANAAAPTNAVRVTSQADYDQLAPGTHYVDSQGNEGVK